MASTSTSSDQKRFKYDVFLSFRGEDTRMSFVDHLYHALEQKGIETYKDDEKIRKGKTISDELIKAIEDSRFYIIVFSKNYASSSWCLEELVKIIERQKMTEHIAYPVFYDVEPTEVRKLYGPVGEAFKKHEKEEAAGKWREALKEAAALAGWELKTTANGHEANFIQKIIQEISLELRFINSSVDENLVGMETRVNAIISSLETGVDDVRMLGIKGMGGAGKTTLASAVFDKISFQFEGQSFVENIREESKPSLSGLKSLQKQLLSDVLNDQGIGVSGVREGKKMIEKKMRVRKVLIVLDDVDKIEQLEALVGDHNWFKPGSRIIITTRDEQVLVAHNVCLIENVNLLSTEEAICLFSRYAFGEEVPVPGYEELSRQVVCYAAGLPLTIKVLGSFLCGKNDLDWEDAIERLKTIPLKETLDKLELSYMGLEEDYKEILLDVACILKGWQKDNAVIALECCGFHARNGLRVLEQRSLLNISYGGYLGMHDHIEELGKNIVRRVNPNKPETHSRLWISDEIKEILANESATHATKCITLNASGFNSKILMKGLTNMKELRILRVYGPCISEDEVSNWNLPNALRFLSWHDYPFSSFPKTFQAKNIVGLEMKNSNMIQLWKDGGKKPCFKLRFLKFTSSDQLRTLDLSVAPNLEKLILENCDNLVEVNFQVTPNLTELRILHCKSLFKLHMPAECPKLRSLDLSDLKLRSLHLGITPNLETLRVENCTDMVELHMPVECPELRSLDLSDLKLRSLHLGITPNLETLRVEKCTDMAELHMPVECPELRSLDLSDLKLRSLLLGITPILETLRVKNSTDMVKLHMPAECPKLRSLDLSDLKLESLHLGITPNLETLKVKNCTDMVELHMPTECPKLIYLDLSDLKLRSLHPGITPNLETLRVKKCTDMELHMPAECPKLVNLDLSKLKLRNLHLMIAPNLERVSLHKCNDMVKLHMPAECPKLVNLDLYNLKLRTLHLGITPNLKTLSLYKCKDMVKLHITAECPKLVTLHLNGNVRLRTLDLGLTPNLESLDIYNCYNLEEINAPAECLKKLLHLDISHCGRFKSFEFDIELNSTEVVSLSELHLIADHTGICDPGNTWPEFQFSGYYKEAPASSFGNLERLISLAFGARINVDFCSDIICALQCLRKLTLEGGIPEAPKNLDQLECIEELIFKSAKIRNLPDSICKLKHLKYLELKSCLLLKKLPDDLGRIESLETLIITNCDRLRYIPNNMGKIKRVISPEVYKRYTHGKFKQRPMNDAVDRPTGSTT